MLNSPTPRTWIVQLAAKAGFRFEGDQELTVVAAADSTLPVHGVRLRNHRIWASTDHSEGAPTFVGAFVAEAAGDFTSQGEAVAILANLANPYFQVLALITMLRLKIPKISSHTLHPFTLKIPASS